MARNLKVGVDITGDASGATKAFGDVGDSAKRMSDDVGSSGRDIAGAVDGAEGKFRGLSDTIGGVGGVIDGFKSGNVAQMALGFADLAGGMKDLVIPAINSMRGVLMTSLAPALTAISAHPLIAGILAGGAIILGLVALEKKFGLVSTVIDAVKGALSGLWDLFKSGWNNTFGKISINFDIPDWVPGVGGKGFHFDFPKLHTGGVFPGVAGREGLAVLQAGETVVPQGQGAGGNSITINVSALDPHAAARAVTDALRNAQLYGYVV